MSNFESTISTRFQASIIDFEAQVKKMAATNERAAKKIERDALKSSTAMKSAWEKNNFSTAITAQIASVESLSASFGRLVPAIAAVMSAAGVASLTEQWNEFSNSLKKTGLAGSNLKEVQTELIAISKDSGAGLKSLGDLYASVSNASGDLGLGQQQIIALTNSVSLGLKATGISSTEASGALMQLGQALESGVVHAQEFNSINMTMHPLLVAAAKASEKYGGSVAKMREDMIKGNLTSAEFARLITAASTTLQSQVGAMATTQSQAMNRVQTSLIEYAGQVDQTLDINAKLVAILNLVANNVDLIADAAMIAAAVIGGRMVASMGAYAVSTVASAAGTFAFCAAMKGIPLTAAAAEVSIIGLRTAGASLLAIFGGPIGLAITGVTLAIGALVAAHMQEEARLKALTDNANEYAAANKEAADKAAILKSEQTKTSNDMPAHLKAVAAMTGEVGLLGNAYYNAAVQAKNLRLEEEKTSLGKTLKDIQAGKKEINSARRRDHAGSVIVSPAGGAIYKPSDNPADYQSPETRKRILENNERVAAYNRQLGEFQADQKTSLKDKKWQSGEAATPKPTKGTKQTDRSQKALDDAAKIQLAVALANTKIESDKHKIRLQMLELEKQQETAEIASAKDLNAKAKATKTQAVNAKYLSDVNAENLAYNTYRKAQETAINDALNSQLGIKLELVETAAEQRDIANQQLDYAHKQALAEIDLNDAYDAETKVKLKQIEEQNNVLQIEKQNKEYAQKQADERKTQLEALSQLTQMQSDLLLAEASIAKTRQERAALEKQALLVRQKSDLLQKKNDLDEDVRAKRKTPEQAQAEMDGYVKLQGYDRRSQEKSNQSPLDAYYEDIGNFDDAYSNIVVDSLKEIDSSINGLIDGTKSFGDVFNSVANGVLADITRIVLRQYLIKPIAKLLGAGDDNSDRASNSGIKIDMGGGYTTDSIGKSSAGDIITDATSLAKMFGIPGFKSGVENFSGGLAMVHKDEALVNLAAGTSVMTAARTRNLLSGGKPIQMQAPQVHQYFNSTINADGVKTTEMFKGWIAQASQTTAAQAKQAAMSGIRKSDRNTIR
jgi:tape measure domain-containing protein